MAVSLAAGIAPIYLTAEKMDGEGGDGNGVMMRNAHIEDDLRRAMMAVMSGDEEGDRKWHSLHRVREDEHANPNFLPTISSYSSYEDAPSSASPNDNRLLKPYVSTSHSHSPHPHRTNSFIKNIIK